MTVGEPDPCDHDDDRNQSDARDRVDGDKEAPEYLRHEGAVTHGGAQPKATHGANRKSQPASL
jgi:hypothetical protein